MQLFSVFYVILAMPSSGESACQEETDSQALLHLRQTQERSTVQAPCDAFWDLKATAHKLASVLPEVVQFEDYPQDGFEGNSIEGGYDYMFYDGNYISVKAHGIWSDYLNYTQKCDGANWTKLMGASLREDLAGTETDVEYFTCRFDVIGKNSNSTFWFAGFRSETKAIEGLGIHSELGSDGEGFFPSSVKLGKRTIQGKEFYGYANQKILTSDPSINHLFLVSDGAGGDLVQAGPDYDGYNQDELILPKGVDEVLFVLWGGDLTNSTIKFKNGKGSGTKTGFKYSDEEFQDAFDSVVAKNP